MPINLIDKFNKIIFESEENKIDAIDNLHEADKFWKQVSKKDETGRWELVNKMHEFNINNYDELVALLGYKSVGTIYNYLQGRNPVGAEFKKRLYNFFSDETNIQIPKTTKHNDKYKIGNKPRKANKELDAYYKKTDFKALLKEYGLTNIQIASAIGVHNSTVSQMTCKGYKPSYRIIQLVKDYLDNVIANKQEETIKNSDYISKQVLLDKCENEIVQYQTTIEEYQKQIKELESKIELTSKLVEFVSKM